MQLHWTIILLIGICESKSAIPCNERVKKPNIVIILADDLGFNDVSIHGSNQIPTPNIDALGVMGIQLNQIYGAPICTPSRSCLVTGKFESNTGMHHGIIGNYEPYGLGLHEKTMANYMKLAGYSTHLIGKWHLGFFEKEYTPLYRGFDSHFGYYGGWVTYFNYTCGKGYDMRENLEVNYDAIGHYATDLFTDKAIEKIEQHDKCTPMFLLLSQSAPHSPNQAPEEEIAKFNYIDDENRRTYAAMVSKLDQSVGRVVKALDENGMLDNSIILFMTDNGAAIEGRYSNSGSNAPFKGQKDSPWEGGVRTTAAIFSPLLEQRERVSNQMIHITDWLPTLASVAGIDIDGYIDGKNMWNALSMNSPSPRDEILVHYDPVSPSYMAYISNIVVSGSTYRFKLVNGTTYGGSYDQWLSPPIDPSQQNSDFGENYSTEILKSVTGQVLSKYSNIRQESIDDIRSEALVTCNGHTPPALESIYACNALVSPCLFDILNDPCETTNLASTFPQIVEQMRAKLDYYGHLSVSPRNKPGDPRANPANFNDTWTWWNSNEHTVSTSRLNLSSYHLTALAFILINFICN